jgi:hypothetical protein
VRVATACRAASGLPTCGCMLLDGDLPVKSSVNVRWCSHGSVVDSSHLTAQIRLVSDGRRYTRAIGDAAARSQCTAPCRGAVSGPGRDFDQVPSPATRAALPARPPGSGAVPHRGQRERRTQESASEKREERAERTDDGSATDCTGTGTGRCSAAKRVPSVRKALDGDQLERM